ncbi:MAG TPA: hypothetical protein VFL91_24900 [Thermomicrobiales bacterium]|nr:hypothetical protein [Thermomicrobiales bacterium]
MTNRLCGTCRFFETSTVQTHGWCRNPAYPRRDEMALLRGSELGCREGWGKDFWEARAEPSADPVAVTAPAPAAPAAHAAPELNPVLRADTPTLPAAPPPVSAYRAGAPEEPPAGQDVLVGFDPRLSHHPELGENGVPLPRARRSTVAEAHRRALERRKAERELQDTRRATVPEQPLGLPQAGAASVLGAGLRQAPPERALRPAPAEREVSVLAAPPTPPAQDPGQARSERRADVAPRDGGAPAPEPPTMPARPAPAPPRQAPEPAARPPAATTEMPRPPAAAGPPAGGRGEPRYWDQPAPAPRFVRMRPPAEEEGERHVEAPRTVRQVGRARQEPAPPPPAERPERAERTIRQLDRTQPIPRPEAGGRALRGEPLPREAPAPAELPPRQVDPSLIQQLAVDWREQELHKCAGKRCGTCRYFRPGDNGRGACGCEFSPVYRQTLPAQELGCLTGLGNWWIETDDGWLEKTEPRRPRRATPLLDALERELAEQAAHAERRRGVR